MTAKQILQQLLLSACSCAMLATCPALEVAEKHLDTLLQNSRSGSADSILVYRMQAHYLIDKALIQCIQEEQPQKVSAEELQDYLQENSGEPALSKEDALKSDLETALHALHLADNLAKARYKAGFAPVDIPFETGAELYHASRFYAQWCEGKDGPPVPEGLLELHATITKAAAAAGDTERQMKADVLRYRYIEPDAHKVQAIRKALVERIEQKLRAGMASQWELREAKLDLQECELFLNLWSEDSDFERFNVYAADTAKYYADLEKAAATGMQQVATPERLLRARLRMLVAAALQPY